MCAREIEEDIELGLGQVPRAEDQSIVGDAEPSGVRQDIAGVSVDAQAEIKDKELGSVLVMPVFAPPYAPVRGKPAADGSLDDGGCRLRDHGPMVTAWEAADEQTLAVLRPALSPSSLPCLSAGPLTAACVALRETGPGQAWPWQVIRSMRAGQDARSMPMDDGELWLAAPGTVLSMESERPGRIWHPRPRCVGVKGVSGHGPR
jgi:hypothetical protein